MEVVSNNEPFEVNGGAHHTGSGGRAMQPLNEDAMYEDRHDVEVSVDSPVTLEDGNNDGDKDLHVEGSALGVKVDYNFDHDGNNNKE